jgi:hypothetical protein
MAVNLDIVKELVQFESRGKSDARQNVQLVCPADLPMHWRIEFEERAAILEYDGGLSRDGADSQALDEILERIKNVD